MTFKRIYKKLVNDNVNVSGIADSDVQANVMKLHTAAELAGMISNVAWAFAMLDRQDQPPLTIASLKMDPITLSLLPLAVDILRSMMVDVPESESGKQELVPQLERRAVNFEELIVGCKSVCDSSAEQRPTIHVLVDVASQLRVRVVSFKSDIVDAKSERLTKVLERTHEFRSNGQMTGFFTKAFVDALSVQELRELEVDLFADLAVGCRFCVGYLEATHCLPENKRAYVFVNDMC